MKNAGARSLPRKPHTHRAGRIRQNTRASRSGGVLRYTHLRSTCTRAMYLPHCPPSAALHFVPSLFADSTFALGGRSRCLSSRPARQSPPHHESPQLPGCLPPLRPSPEQICIHRRLPSHCSSIIHCAFPPANLVPLQQCSPSYPSCCRPLHVCCLAPP